MHEFKLDICLLFLLNSIFFIPHPLIIDVLCFFYLFSLWTSENYGKLAFESD